MLTFKEFIKLSLNEKERRYCEMSDHDKFLARMNDWGPSGISDEEAQYLIEHPPAGWEEVFKEIFKDKTL